MNGNNPATIRIKYFVDFRNGTARCKECRVRIDDPSHRDHHELVLHHEYHEALRARMDNLEHPIRRLFRSIRKNFD